MDKSPTSQVWLHLWRESLLFYHRHVYHRTDPLQLRAKVRLIHNRCSQIQNWKVYLSGNIYNDPSIMRHTRPGCIFVPSDNGYRLSSNHLQKKEMSSGMYVRYHNNTLHLCHANFLWTIVLCRLGMYHQQRASLHTAIYPSHEQSSWWNLEEFGVIDWSRRGTALEKCKIRWGQLLLQPRWQVSLFVS
jgi:hypothetical protein